MATAEPGRQEADPRPAVVRPTTSGRENPRPLRQSEIGNGVRCGGDADAPQVIVVLSQETVNSRWVAREVRAALEVQRERGDG